jgi:pimeloyl-ACP methyl ester carboxylesterase
MGFRFQLCVLQVVRWHEFESKRNACRCVWNLRMHTFAPRCATLLCLVLSWTSAIAAHPFDVGGTRAVRGQCIVLQGDVPLLSESLPDMLARQHGVLHELTSQELAQLLKVGSQTKPARNVGDATPIMRLRLIGAGKPNESKPSEGKPTDGKPAASLPAALTFIDRVISLADTGEVVIEGEPRLLLTDDRWQALALSLRAASSGGPASIEGRVLSPAPVAGVPRELKGEELVPSSIVFDGSTLKERFTRSGATLQPVQRTLQNEKMFLRLPRDNRPKCERIARGLIVYLHPAPQSGVPQELHAVLDELSLICIAPDNVGNDRDRVQRMQLALDAIATAQHLCTIDASRIYLVGLSGGGKIGTHTWAAAPDVVQGVCAIVAVGSYEHMRRSDGKYWQGDFLKPASKTLATMSKQRLAAITGDKDGNQDYIRKALAVMDGDGLTTKLYDFADLGHEFPSAARVRDAVWWIDEPARTKAEEKNKLASDIMKPSQPAPAKDKELPRKDVLLRALEAAPFSEAAWQAAEELVAGNAMLAK